MHVADGIAAERAGEELQQTVGEDGGGLRVRRLAAGPQPARQPKGLDLRQIENGPVPADQGERDQVQGGAADDRREAQTDAGTLRRLAGQRAQHVQLAGGLGHQPVRRPGDVRVFRPGRHRPGGEAARQDHHKHQPHTLHVRHHAADQRRRGEPQDPEAVGERRLRRVRDAGASHARRVRDNRRARARGTPGVRALERTAGRFVGEEKGDGRGAGDVERRGQSDIHVGQFETEKEDSHDQHVRARAVRKRRRRQRPVSRQQEYHISPSTRWNVL